MPALDSSYLTFHYRLLPSKKQHLALESILESQRQLYNAALEERIEAFKKCHVRRTYIDQSRGLTEWRQTDPEAASLPANLQRWTLKAVDTAFRSFFGRRVSGLKAGWPRFRGPGRFRTFGFLQFSGIVLKNGAVRFAGLPGRLRIHFHRPLPLDVAIRSCAFRRGPKGWSISLYIRVPMGSPRRNLRPTRIVGLDLGLSTLAALSDGVLIPSLRAAQRAERRIRMAQRSVSRKTIGSRSREKAKASLRRCYGAVIRQRSNHLHQATARLVRDYDCIAMESLDVGGLGRGWLSKPINDVAWGTFISMLRYKAERAGVRLIEVDPRSTSQECSGCGASTPMTLADRTYDCSHCGLTLDRDVNAARNILNRAGVGPSLLNVARCMRAGGNLDLLGNLSGKSSHYPSLQGWAGEWPTPEGQLRSVWRETRKMKLTQEQLGRFEQDGFLFFPELFSPEEIKALTDEVPRLYAQRRPENVREKASEAVRTNFAAHLYSKPFARLARHPRMVDPVVQVFNEEVYIHQFKINGKMAFDGDVWQWHQDYGTWMNDDLMPDARAMNVAIFLDEVNEFNGPLMFIPGSHKQGALPAGHDTSTTSYPLWTIDKDTISQLVARGGIVAPKGPPGSMILFHGCLVHASTSNLSPWNRVSVYLSLCAVSNHIRRFKRPEYIAHRDFTPIVTLPDDCLLKDYDVALPWKDGTPESAYKTEKEAA